MLQQQQHRVVNKPTKPRGLRAQTGNKLELIKCCTVVKFKPLPSLYLCHSFPSDAYSRSLTKVPQRTFHCASKCTQTAPVQKQITSPPLCLVHPHLRSASRLEQAGTRNSPVWYGWVLFEGSGWDDGQLLDVISGIFITATNNIKMHKRLKGTLIVIRQSKTCSRQIIH